MYTLAEFCIKIVYCVSVPFWLPLFWYLQKIHIQLFKESIYETDFRFIIIFQDKKGSPATSLAGKKPPSTGSNPTENGLLEGISSLHSWIKSQTMIKPAGREKEDIPGLIRANYNNDEVMNAIIIRNVNEIKLKYHFNKFQ